MSLKSELNVISQRAQLLDNQAVSKRDDFLNKVDLIGIIDDLENLLSNRNWLQILLNIKTIILTIQKILALVKGIFKP